MQDLDVTRLGWYLGAHIDGCAAPMQLARLQGGQSNPTDRLTGADGTRLVLHWRLSARQFRGMAGTDYAALGIPTESAYLRSYCRRVGRDPVDPAHWEFFLAYAMFRLTAILRGIMKRALDGNAASAGAFATGSRARPIAEAAWRQVTAHFAASAR